MSNTPESEEPGTYSLDMEGYGSAAECNPSAANDNSDWVSLGDAVFRVVNLSEARRKKGREAVGI